MTARVVTRTGVSSSMKIGGEAIRRGLLLACAERLDAHTEELARLGTSEQGAPLRASLRRANELLPTLQERAAE